MLFRSKITAIAHNGVYKTRSVTIGEFNGGKGTTSSPYKVNNSLQLASMNKHLASNYVLTSDINLKNAEFKPIGAFVPKGSEGEDAETPIVEKAFSGTLDGANYTISNLKINQPKKVDDDRNKARHDAALIFFFCALFSL